MAVWLAVAATGSPLRQPRASEQPPEWLIHSVLRWLPLVERWHPEFPDLDPAWILAIIAQESQGNAYVEGVDGANSIGLMQIIARSWTGTKEQLKRPEYNTFVGMRMLHAILGKADGDIRLALAAYNCGWEGVEEDDCGNHGGRRYAARVLDYYVPTFRAELVVRAGDRDIIGNWLAGLGYLYGTGKWDEEVIQPIEPICVRQTTTGRICMI